MSQDLRVLASELRGDASDRLTRLFDDYDLADAAYRDLDSRSSVRRIQAADALGAMRIRSAVPQLREHLRREDSPARVACARALAEIGDVAALPEVLEALGEADAPPGDIADVLLRFGTPGTPYLRTVLEDSPDPAPRRLAAVTLGEIGAAAAIPELAAALHSTDDELVASAVRSLGKIGDVRTIDSLVELLRADKAWFVQVAAARAIAALDVPGAAHALVELLEAEEWDVRNAAAEALAKMGEAGFRAVLRDLDPLSDRAVAHYAGVLDMLDELGPVIVRAAGGDREAGRFVERILAAGVRARLEEAATGSDTVGWVARRILDRSPARARTAAPVT